MKKLMTICCLAVTMILAVSASATTVNYTVSYWGGLPPAFQGDLWHGDTLEFLAYSGTLDLTPGTQTLKVNTFDWIIDATSYNPAYFYPIATRSISIDGGPSGSLSQAGTLSCLSDNDYVTFIAGSSVSFNVQGYTVDVTPLAFSRQGEGPFSLPWPQAESDVMATFVVTQIPEPATMLLLGIGGLLCRKFRKA